MPRKQNARADADETRLSTDPPIGMPEASPSSLPRDVNSSTAPELTRLAPSDPGETMLSPGDLTTLGPAADDVTEYRPIETRRQPGQERRGSHTPPPGGAGASSSDPGPLEPGSAFGARYHIIRLLGIGGMGAVYQAWDAELGVSVALKVIRPEVMADPKTAAEIERRFKRELLLARQVTHKNVVRIHDLGELDGIKFITMPYVAGADLATILKSGGRLPVARVMPIARAVVSGLVEAHKVGVVHRDLKPANIMIGAEDEAMIMDFGIARSTSAPVAGPVPGANTIVRNLSRAAADQNATVLGAVVGTVEYMAPEQARGVNVDQRADVYAFGLILYDMLVGRPRAEHAGSAIAELQGRMQHAPPAVKSVVPEVPEELDRIIRRCLEPDADKRFQTSAELAADLNRLDDEGVPIPEPRRFTPRMIAAGVMLVASLVTATWWFTRTPPPEKPHDPVTVVIADFENKTNDTSFDHTLEPMLKLALEGASFISAHDRTRMRAAFGIAVPEKLDEAAARQIAIKQAAGIVLSGSIDRKGSGYEVAVKAAQPITGNVVADARGSASSKEQVLATATKLATTVRKVLGDKTSESTQLFAMKSISTTSLEVVGHYAAGVELQSKAKYGEALQEFLTAVELDPKFGLGYQSAAAMSRNLGRLEDAEKYAKAALGSLDTMTERERFNVRGYYYRTTGDLKKCVDEYGEMLARYSADTVAHNQRAVCQVGLRHMREAVAELRQAIQILPNHATYRANLAIFTNYAGDFVAAEREVRAMKEPSPRGLLALAFSQSGQGQLQEAAATYRKLAATGTFGATFAPAGLADLALYEGRFGDAVKIFEQGAAADLAAKNSDSAANKFAALAYVHLMRGQKQAAAAAAEKALANTKGVAFRFLATRILVETGAVAKAHALAADLMSQVAAEPSAYGKILEGEIALKKGDLPQAIKILTEANGVIDTWLGHFDLGRAYLEAKAFAQADSEFDICIKRRGEALSLLNEEPTYGYFPPVYYYQGRAREGLQTAGFAASYREYLKIRGNSTEDPLLPDIRKRVGN
ncbi:MAG TPA: protein kinase [Vicinamibacterales bacterium]|nr:protein kinase [Vicinamibacterales bacterium]